MNELTSSMGQIKINIIDQINADLQNTFVTRTYLPNNFLDLTMENGQKEHVLSNSLIDRWSEKVKHQDSLPKIDVHGLIEFQEHG